MSLPTQPTQKLDPGERSNRTGIVTSRGGLITIGTPVTDVNGNPEYFKILHFASGGDVVVQAVDGNFIPRRGIPDGQSWAVEGVSVVTSAVFNGTTITTSASNICWGGGA